MCEGKIIKYIVGGSIVVVLIMSISLIATSLHKLETDEVGLSYNVYQRKLDSAPKRTGLHAGPPGYKFIKYPSVFKSLNFTNVACLNKEGIAVKLIVQLQYRARVKDLYQITLQFKDSDHYVILLKNAALSVIHDACSQFNTSQFQTNRANFQELVRNLMGQRYGKVWGEVTDLQVQNIQRPAAFEKVVRSKESAKENIKIAENQRPRLLIQAHTKKEEAIRKADITIQNAETSAEVLLANARAEASSIMAALGAESETLRKVMDDQGLDVNGVLSYLGTRVIAENTNQVNIGFDPPAKTQFFP